MVRFALFDWLDESGRGFGETYEERLQMLEYADEAGFACYHLAEHHGTALSTVPSPNLFLASVAQRTKRIRLVPHALQAPRRHENRSGRAGAQKVEPHWRREPVG